MDLAVIEPHGGDVTAGVQLTFKNASGGVVGIASEQYSLNLVHRVGVNKIVPATATKVRVALGANQPPHTNTRLALLNVDIVDYGMDSDGNCVPPSCDSCEISCQPGYKLNRNCGQTAPPACHPVPVLLV